MPHREIYSVEDLKRVYERTSQGHWFEKSTMQFFQTRLTSHFRIVNEKEFLFVTTEKGPSGIRKASLRRCTIEASTEKHCGYKMQIETVGDFNSMTIYQAKKLMMEVGSV